MQNKTKECPYCGEEILSVAKKCRYCGEWIEQTQKKPSQNIIYIITGIIVLLIIISIVSYCSLNKAHFIEGKMPKKYLADEQIPQSEIWYTLRYDLFNLYKFQQLSPSKRINEFEDVGRMMPIPDMLAGFADKNQQYKIADNYCIKYKNRKLKFDNQVYDDPTMIKVACTNPKPITDLPYEKCKNFKFRQLNKNNAKIYYTYDIKSLWEEFRNKGIRKIENEITREENAVKAMFN